MSSVQSPSSTRLDPKIRYYIHRTNGNAIVPLIPADQLPFKLRDFPKNLNHRQLSEGGWKFLDETAEVPFPLLLLTPKVQGPEGRQLHLEFSEYQNLTEEALTEDGLSVNASAGAELSNNEIEPEGLLSELPAIVASTTSTKTKNRSDDSANHVSISKIKSLADSMAAIYTQDARRLRYTKSTHTIKAPVLEKEREFCRRWIRTGECVHAIKGCWYKHEMPSVEKLRDLGIGSVPQWYQQKGRVTHRSLLKGSAKNATGIKSSCSTTQNQDVQLPAKVDRNHGAECGAYTTDTADEPMLMDMDMNDVNSEDRTNFDNEGILTTTSTPTLSNIVSTSLEQSSEPNSSSPSPTHSVQATFAEIPSQTTINVTAITTPSSKSDVSSPSHTKTAPSPPSTSSSGTSLGSIPSQSPPSVHRKAIGHPNDSCQSDSSDNEPVSESPLVPATRQSSKVQSDSRTQNLSTRSPDSDAAKLAKVFSKRKFVSKRYKKHKYQDTVSDAIRKVGETAETAATEANAPCNAGGLVRVEEV